MEPWDEAEPADTTLILRTLFEINTRLTDVGSDVKEIRNLLEEDDDDGDEDDEELR